MSKGREAIPALGFLRIPFLSFVEVFLVYSEVAPDHADCSFCQIFAAVIWHSGSLTVDSTAPNLVRSFSLSIKGTTAIHELPRDVSIFHAKTRMLSSSDFELITSAGSSSPCVL